MALRGLGSIGFRDTVRRGPPLSRRCDENHSSKCSPAWNGRGYGILDVEIRDAGT